MKPLLALAGCGARLEVGLYGEPGLASCVVLGGSTPRSEYVVAAVDLLLRAAAIPATELEAVVASRGPGSFTGVRVALATAQGIALASSIPSAGFSSLLVQAARVARGPCLAVQPARRGFAYAQPFEPAAPVPVPSGAAQVVDIGSLRHSALPVIAPGGLDLAPGTPLAPVAMTATEALAGLFRASTEGIRDGLTPLYLEPPAITPPAPRTVAWLRSPTAS